MKKIILGTAITLAILLLLTGCGESAEDKAKLEFKEKMLSIKPENFFIEVEKTKDFYEKEYGMKANVWFEELKETNEWEALGIEALKLRSGKAPKY
ncbi:hypothetical protein [Arcobacter defluvii]|uniref:Uncharacterized protein n=1 Tax=Arcobacter defluvii TaxID=873191 RepID=A0AAE7E7A6_9BACT|nr:hypothetical protein [Arcobacter defluvii]QKF77300.1 hypothetical protein ADFLV_1268 [Arcobacter defluvii]QKF77856.1 hypothetical protein ADFLV_1838 [Arcobacter defluvii]RXI29648.1 hypothetical protein CP964_13455 [Arcobacter defluvii]